MEDIRADMLLYERGFEKNIIPHINETGEIVDKIHNYHKAKEAKTGHSNGKPTEPETKKDASGTTA